MQQAVLLAAALLVSSSLCQKIKAQDAPPPDSLDGIHMAGTMHFGGRNETELTLHACALKEEFIYCDYVVTRHFVVAADYNAANPEWSDKLVDNFHIDHQLAAQYFLDGKGNHRDVVTLANGDWIWFIQQFRAADPGIKCARVIFPGGRYLVSAVAGGNPVGKPCKL